MTSAPTYRLWPIAFLLAWSAPLIAGPIGPQDLLDPMSNPAGRQPLHPGVFEVDFIRTGIEAGLGSPLIRYDKAFSDLIGGAIIKQAILQVHDRQSRGTNAPPKAPEADNPRDTLANMRSGITPAAPAALGDTDEPWLIRGNRSSEDKPMFLGTLDRAPLLLGSKGYPLLRLESTPFSPNVIAGDPANTRRDSVIGATISGGGDVAAPNQVHSDFGTIGGGVNNSAGSTEKFLDSPFTTISGGRNNRVERRHGTIGGGINNEVNAQSGTVAGGSNNRVKGEYGAALAGHDNLADGRHTTIAGGTLNQAIAEAASVGGGEDNLAKGLGATISGGMHNRALGNYATIPGGLENHADGIGSLAAGSFAKARHDGSFVWADNTAADFASTSANQFLIRASGNVGIDHTNPPEKLTVSGHVAPGKDDSFNLGSDALRWRHLKLSGGIDYVGNMTISDKGSPRMKLDEDGNLLVAGRVITQAFSGNPQSHSAGTSGPTTAAPINTSPAPLPDTLQQLSKQMVYDQQGNMVLLSPRLQLEGSLNVRGPLNVSKGIRFPDGSVLTSAKANQAGSATPTAAADPRTQALLSGLDTRMRAIETTPRELQALAKRVGSLEAKRPTSPPTADGNMTSAMDERTSVLEKGMIQLVDDQVLTAKRLTALAGTFGSHSDTRSRIDSLEQSVKQLESQTARLGARPAAANNSANTPDNTPVSKAELAALKTQQAQLSKQVATLAKAASATAPAPNLAPIEARLKQLDRELSSLKAAPPTTAAKADPAIQAELNRLSLKLSDLENAQLPPAPPLHSGNSSNQIDQAMRKTVQGLGARQSQLERKDLEHQRAMTDLSRQFAELAAKRPSLIRPEAKPAPAPSLDLSLVLKADQNFAGDVTGTATRLKLRPGAVGLEALNLLELDQRYLSKTRDQLTLRKGSIRTEASTPLTISINDVPVLRLSPGEKSPQLVGGHAENEAGRFEGAVIVGGGSENRAQRIEGDFAFIGGGFANQAAAGASLVGGIGNQARGATSMIPGGANNRTTGRLSLAAGNRAQALHDGSFVWADSQDADQDSKRPDQFVVRAQGGVSLYTKAGEESVLQLAPGGRAWQRRANPTDLASARQTDPVEVLRKVLTLPVAERRNANGSELVVAASSFEQAFRTGAPDGYIDTATLDNALVASVQGLFALIEEQQKQISDLSQRLKAVEGP